MPVELTGLGGPGATITLDAPQRLNAFGRQDLLDLSQALDRCADDPEVACVVLRGRGRAFCAGADLALIEEVRRAPAAERRASLVLAPSVMLQIAQFPKPTIAAVQGAAFGGGACIALACDDVVLAEDARLGFIFTSLGLPGGDSAATWLLSRRVGTRQAWRLLSRGAIIGAQEAAAAGLADAVVPLDRLSEEVAERAADYGRRSATALAATKQQLLRLDGVGSFLEPAMDRELAAMLAAFEGPDLAEGLAAHHQKREPRWPSRAAGAGPAGGTPADTIPADATAADVPEQRGQRWHDRRTAIVDTAAKLFAERGYHATGTAELCQAAGLGKGSLYYYVDSKENLLYLIHERVMEQVFDTATRIAGLDEPAAERLRQLGQEQISVIARYPDHVWVFLHEYRALTGERANQFTASRRRYERSIETILQDGVDSGEFVIDDVHLAALGWLGMHNYTYIWFQPGKKLTAARLASAFYDLFIEGVSAPARRTSRSSTG